MASLFEINAEIEELVEQMIDPETGEIDESVVERISDLTIDLDVKLESYGLVMKQLQAEANALIEESKALKKRAEVKLKKMDRMGELVKRVLDGTPREYKRVKFGFRPSKSVEIVNEDLVPDKLCFYKNVKQPKKAEIKKLLNAGKEVPGCVLVEHENLQLG